MTLALSRTALEQHIRCPRCFYLERKLGLKGPSMVPLTLAVATDALLKTEFDAYRGSGAAHPLWEREGLRVRAYQHADIDVWRSNRRGIRVHHAPADVEVYGSVDDVWENLDTGELHIVDYKSTSKKETPTLDGGFGEQYKRQIEIYQWLFRQTGHRVSPVAYFLYVNGSKEGGFYANGLDGQMRFVTTLIAHVGNDAWVPGAIAAAAACHAGSVVPAAGRLCDTCRYVREREGVLGAGAAARAEIYTKSPVRPQNGTAQLVLDELRGE